MKITSKLTLAVTASLFALHTPVMAQEDELKTAAEVAAEVIEVVAETATAVEAEKDGPTLGTYGFDTEGMDTATAAGDNFFRYASGKWLDKTEIPSDRSNYGMFTALAELSNKRVKKVLEAEKNNPDSKAGAVYYSYLDEATVEKLGMKPVTPWLNRIRGVQNKIALQQLIPVAARDGIRGVFGGFVGQDDKDP